MLGSVDGPLVLDRMDMISWVTLTLSSCSLTPSLWTLGHVALSEPRISMMTPTSMIAFPNKREEQLEGALDLKYLKEMKGWHREPNLHSN